MVLGFAFFEWITKTAEMPRRTTTISLNDADDAMFAEAMERDGATQFSTWAKMVLRRYATGQLVPVDQMKGSDREMFVAMLKQMNKDAEK